MSELEQLPRVEGMRAQYRVRRMRRTGRYRRGGGRR
jgi:hypothetical protein